VTNEEFRFSLLGPVRAWYGDTELALGAAQQRAVLAVLLSRAGAQVPMAELVAALWGNEPPRSAEQIVRTYVYRLRRALQAPGAEPLIASVGGGYRLQSTSAASDAVAFIEAVGGADRMRRSGDPAGAVAVLRAALEGWRGEPLADVPGPFAEAQRESLLRTRRSATEQLLAADVELGPSDDTVAELADLVAGDPLNERLRELLMLALYRHGEQARALQVYRDGADVLAAELGIDPGPALRAMFERILRSDPELMAPVQPVVPTQSGGVPTRPFDVVADDEPAAPTRPAVMHPAQLPADLPTFTGRAADLARLDALLVRTGARPSTVTVAAVTGMAGIGKTTLAVHWAHRVAHRYPDGVVHLNLHGFDPSVPALSPGEAIDAVLQSFGIGYDAIPVSPDAKASLYRSLLADRRVLLLLDNARSADQVRPLLPGAPGSLVVITSRDRLTGLVSRDGAHPVRLDALDADAARALLAARLGADRVAAEPAAVVELLDRCGGLPLALAVLATRALTHTSFSLADVAAELRALHAGLDAFADDDSASDVRGVFSCSYRALRADAARMFRLLAERSDPTFAVTAAASVLAVPVSRARALATELVRAELLVERTPGRLAYHDLLRAYAAELAAETDPEPERTAGLRRLLDHHVLSARAAAAALYPDADLAAEREPAEGVVVVDFADRAAALAWFAEEHPALRSATFAAVRAGFDSHVCEAARSMADFFQRQGRWTDQLALQDAAVAAARRLGDDAARARAHRTLANTYGRLGRHGDAIRHFAVALDLLQELDDQPGQARVHRGLAAAWGGQERYDIALAQSREAHDRYLMADDRGGRASALNDIGWCLAQLGDQQRALESCQEALALFEQLGNDDGAAATWDSIGYIQHHLGDLAAAQRSFGRAIELFGVVGDLHSKLAALTHLGDTREAAGDPVGARRAWQEGLDIARDLGAGQAEQLQARLAGDPVDS
jgi:DNA-binding SARP family transcriptional activator/tetratricopeptide (TPR) repeat protein